LASDFFWNPAAPLWRGGTTSNGGLAVSALPQCSCRLDRIDTVRIPSKSAPQRYSQRLEQQDPRKVVDTLLGAASDRAEGGEQTLELTEALMKATKLIRKRGFKVRMWGGAPRAE
jgi:hypothetical protein